MPFMASSIETMHEVTRIFCVNLVDLDSEAELNPQQVVLCAMISSSTYRTDFRFDSELFPSNFLSPCELLDVKIDDNLFGMVIKHQKQVV
ncbi:hypothetical protein L6164_009947 [Bauhinia variegata]|uniref:Uncharacterized protein n=1 Tax=Bauhinia variegata TaxID=167791 RepID=A0ACB9PLD8_BAUVA|nr:hypothetical protein L6164_009947 [Bauhinia variegata]